MNFRHLQNESTSMTRTIIDGTLRLFHRPFLDADERCAQKGDACPIACTITFPNKGEQVERYIDIFLLL